MKNAKVEIKQSRPCRLQRSE